MKSDLNRLSGVIGRNVRRLRDRAGYSANDVAVRARKVGLPWTRPIVANIETGRRGDVSAAELILLPVVLSTVDIPVTTSDLLEGTERILVAGDESEGTTATPEAILAVLGNSEHQMPGWSFAGLGEARSRVAQEMASVDALLPPGTPAPDATRALDDARGESERQVARRLGVEPVQVAHAARQRWRRSLSEERDARVASRMKSGEAKGSRRGVRGHVTRELIAQLSEDLESYPREDRGEESH